MKREAQRGGGFGGQHRGTVSHRGYAIEVEAAQSVHGFGDAVEPPPRELTLPVLLPAAAPQLWAYSPEAVVAEKLHAMVVLGIANSRMKDFYDL